MMRYVAASSSSPLPLDASAEIEDEWNEEDWEDRPGLTPEERRQYKALEERMKKITRLNGPDGDLADKVGKDFYEVMDKMHLILARGERRYQKADQMKEWEDFAKEPVKVIGSVS